MIQFTVRAGHKTQHVVNNKVHAFALLDQLPLTPATEPAAIPQS